MLVLGEGWSRPSEKELTQARVRGLLLLQCARLGEGFWLK